MKTFVSLVTRINQFIVGGERILVIFYHLKMIIQMPKRFYLSKIIVQQKIFYKQQMMLFKIIQHINRRNFKQTKLMVIVYIIIEELLSVMKHYLSQIQ